MYPVDGYEAYRMGLYDGPTGTMIDGVDEDVETLESMMDDDSDEPNWVEREEERYLNSFGE